MSFLQEKKSISINSYISVMGLYLGNTVIVKEFIFDSVFKYNVDMILNIQICLYSLFFLC